MNEHSMSETVQAAAVRLSIKLRYPWPIGICSHAAFLALAICSLDGDRLSLLFQRGSVIQRKRQLWNCLQQRQQGHAKPGYASVGVQVARYMVQARSNGVDIPEMRRIMLHVLILLRNFRKSTYGKDLHHPTQFVTHATWVWMALKMASTEYKQYDLGT
ncbi:hypothetical protein E8E13_004381 [Curvularia kusanoi]|uniref:Uncharacterized protein n=1 Tax=Curvularia kusanoi TaxID=90978 RepID=A0A9P4TIR6_CURKU|nr:hypothetical protein E8E13_004381 [Curvularia kusanoi]